MSLNGCRSAAPSADGIRRFSRPPTAHQNPLHLHRGWYDADWLTYPRAVYRCACGQEIEFALKDFERHAYSAFTNLSYDDANAIDAAYKDQSGCNSFLDFYCPGCRRPVRFYYQTDALSGSKRHYPYGYEVVLVVEGGDKLGV